VGAGNSAGQAVVYLAAHAAKVWLLVRGQAWKTSMSRYLIDRIAGLPNVELVTQAEVSGLEGRDGVLRRSAGVTAPRARKCGGRSATCSLHRRRAEHRLAVRVRVALDPKGSC